MARLLPHSAATQSDKVAQKQGCDISQHVAHVARGCVGKEILGETLGDMEVNTKCHVARVAGVVVDGQHGRALMVSSSERCAAKMGRAEFLGCHAGMCW